MPEPSFRRGCGDEATYEALRREALRLAVAHADPLDRLQPLCDAFWETLAPRGVSWIGFYLLDPEATVEACGDDARMILVARRDKPACSPIGVHGACGQSFRAEAIRLIEDVALLGAGYIACDPRDRSELVMPIYRNGAAWGVLDADSHEYACFGPAGAAGLASILRAAGLLDRDLPIRADRLQMRSETV